MGGVDLMDRLLGSYRPMIRAKKMVVAFDDELAEHFHCISVEVLLRSTPKRC